MHKKAHKCCMSEGPSSRVSHLLCCYAVQQGIQQHLLLEWLDVNYMVWPYYGSFMFLEANYGHTREADSWSSDVKHLMSSPRLPRRVLKLLKVYCKPLFPSSLELSRCRPWPFLVVRNTEQIQCL